MKKLILTALFIGFLITGKTQNLTIVSGSPQPTTSPSIGLVLSDPTNFNNVPGTSTYNVFIEKGGTTYYSSIDDYSLADVGSGTIQLSTTVTQSTMPSAGTYDVRVFDAGIGSTFSCSNCFTFTCTDNTGTDVQTACDSYTWIDGNTYTESNNTATFTLTNAANCDSVVTLNLTINNSNTGTDVQTACDSFTWIDGNTYTESNNTATFTLTNAANCDSVVTLDLTIITVDVSVTNSDPMLTANAEDAQYQWLDCDNGFAEIPGETNQSFSPSSNGDYAVVVTDGICSDTSDCISVITVGIKENTFGAGFNLFPNPTSDYVILEFQKQLSDASISILDISGKQVYFKNNVNTQKVELSLEDLSSGTYFIQIQSGDEIFKDKLFKK